MIVTTTNSIEGSPIREYRGIAFGEVITGINVFKDIGAGLRNFFAAKAPPDGALFCIRAARVRRSPSPSRARNVPPTDLQRSRGWWSRRGKKGAFLWRLDTVSLGKHQRNGVESQDRATTTSQRIGAHVKSTMTRPPCLSLYTCVRFLGQ